MCSFILSKCSGVELLGPQGRIMFMFIWKVPNSFQKCSIWYFAFFKTGFETLIFKQVIWKYLIYLDEVQLMPLRVTCCETHSPLDPKDQV